jgi:hypothetical protein
MTTKTAEPVAVVPDGIAPPDRRFWVTDDMIPRDREELPYPRFNVIQTATIFFAKSDSWLRMLMREGQFILDGAPLEFRRIPTGNPRGDPRYFTLADIEQMAYALAQQGRINEHTLTCAIQLVKWEARAHGILKD